MSCEPLPAEAAALAPMDVAQAFRDQPGFALLESARPGRRSRWTFLCADPVALLEAPAEGPDVFATARRELARLATEPVASNATSTEEDRPPFLGGLVGYLAYDLGLVFEPRTTLARDDQGLPLLRLGLYDWVVAWDRRSGQAWLGGRAVDGDRDRLARRLAQVRDRFAAIGEGPGQATSPAGEPDGLRFTSNLDRPTFEAGVEAVRDAIARGEIYQANLTRRLQTGFRGDPWALYRCLRTGDPALFAAYLDLGPAPDGTPRAIASASPEPFLTVDATGHASAPAHSRSRARGHAAATGPPTGPSPGSCSPARRTGPRT